MIKTVTIEATITATSRGEIIIRNPAIIEAGETCKAGIFGILKEPTPVMATEVIKNLRKWVINCFRKETEIAAKKAERGEEV